MSRPVLRRLIDQPGIDALEYQALMTPALAEPEARQDHPAFDEASRAIFGLTADEAAEVPRPDDWDGIETQGLAKQVFAFEDAGWDVTDDKRRPLRVLGHFSGPLWLALRGVAGELPFQAESTAPEAWVDKLAAEAKRFQKR